MQIIAEIKTQAPLSIIPDLRKDLLGGGHESAPGWKSDKTWEELFEIANRVGDMIAIHTDPRWGGSFELIARARKMTTKPILAKGIHASDDDVKRAVEFGADKVLVVGRLPHIYLGKCLIEPYTLEELSKLPEGTYAVWNSRDLLGGGLKRATFEEARTVWKGWLCQASNIHTIADVHPGADAVLVGMHLEEFAKSLPKKEL